MKILDSLDKRIVYEPHVLDRIWEELRYSNKPLISLIGILDRMRDEFLQKRSGTGGSRNVNTLTNSRFLPRQNFQPTPVRASSTWPPPGTPLERNGYPLCRDPEHRGRVLYHYPTNCWFNAKGNAFRPEMLQRNAGSGSYSRPGGAPSAPSNGYPRPGMLNNPAASQRKPTQFRQAHAAVETGESEHGEVTQVGYGENDDLWQEMLDNQGVNEKRAFVKGGQGYASQLATFEGVPRVGYPDVVVSRGDSENANAVRLGPGPGNGTKLPKDVNSVTPDGDQIPGRLPSCLPTAHLLIFGLTVPVLLDTGSSCSICPLSLLKALWARVGLDSREEMKKFKMASAGNKLNTVGGEIESSDIAFYPVRMEHISPLDGETYRVTAAIMVINDGKPGAGFGKEFLLGTDLLAPLHCHRLAMFILDYHWTRTCAKRFDPANSNSTKPPRADLPYGNVAQRAEYVRAAVRNSTMPESYKMVSSGTFCVAAGASKVVGLKCADRSVVADKLEPSQEMGKMTWIIDSSQKFCDGEEEKNSYAGELQVMGTVVEEDLPVRRAFQVVVTNHAAQDIEIKRGQKLAEMAPVTDMWTTTACGAVVLPDAPAPGDPTFEVPLDAARAADVLNMLPKEEWKNIPPGVLERFQTLVGKFHDIFSLSEDEIGCTPLIKHKIEVTPGAIPVKVKARYESPSRREIIQNTIEKWERLGIIEKCDSPWGLPLVVARREDGRPRVCVDSRFLNEVTVKSAYALPRIANLVQELGGKSIFSSVDIRDAYHHVEIASSAEKDLVSFVCSEGLFRCNRLSFGLCNAPATFQRLMNLVVSKLNVDPRAPWCHCYLDDILISSTSWDEHLKHVEYVFCRLRWADLKVNPTKSKFWRTKLDYLGFEVHPGGIRPKLSKISAIMEQPVPRTKGELRMWLGQIQYFSQFVEKWLTWTAPLYEYLKGNVPKKDRTPITFSEHELQCIDYLKAALCQRPILCLPRYDRPFYLETDASEHGLGVMCAQYQDDGAYKPVAYVSKKLGSGMAGWSIPQLEALAVSFGIMRLSDILDGMDIVVRTDCRALVETLEKKEKSKLTRWSIYMKTQKVRVEFKKGVNNKFADGLSRLPVESDTDNEVFEKAKLLLGETHATKLHAERECRDDFETADCIDWVAEQRKDSHLQELIRQMDNQVDTKVCLEKGILMYRGIEGFRPFAPQHMRENLIAEAHSGSLGAHGGRYRTFRLLAAFVAWPGMAKEVQLYVDQCDVCRKTKPQKSPPFIPLPSEIEKVPFRKIGVDLMMLPKYGRYTAVLTAVDYCTHFVVFTPVTQHTAANIADTFLRTIIYRYGPPRHVVCDQGAEFVGSAFQLLAKRLGYKIHFTLPRNPRANGMAERAHRTLQQILRAQFMDLGSVNDTGELTRRNWVDEMAQACLRYNCALNRITGLAPFQALHGYLPDIVLRVGSTLQRIGSLTPEVEDLRRAAESRVEETREKILDKSVPTKLVPGSQVYVQRHFESPHSSSRKLAPIWWGPYFVTKVFNNVVQVETDGGTWLIPIDKVSLYSPESPPRQRAPYLPPQPRFEGCFYCRQLGHRWANCSEHKIRLFEQPIKRLHIIAEALAERTGTDYCQGSLLDDARVVAYTKTLERDPGQSDSSVRAAIVFFTRNWFMTEVFVLDSKPADELAKLIGEPVYAPRPIIANLPDYAQRTPLRHANRRRHRHTPYLAPRGTILMRAVMEPNWGKPAPELMELPWKSDIRPIFQHGPRNEDAVYGLANDYRQEPRPAHAASHPNAPQVYRTDVAHPQNTYGEPAKHAVSEGIKEKPEKENVGAPVMSLEQVTQGTSILYDMLDPATTISLMARELRNTPWGKQRAPALGPDLAPLPSYLPETTPSDPQPTVLPKPPVVVVQPFRSERSVTSSCAGEVGSPLPGSPGSGGSIGSQMLFDDADDTEMIEAMAENLSMEEAAAEVDAMLQSPAADPADWIDPDLDDLLPEEI